MTVLRALTQVCCEASECFRLVMRSSRDQTSSPRSHDSRYTRMLKPEAWFVLDSGTQHVVFLSHFAPKAHGTTLSTPTLGHAFEIQESHVCKIYSNAKIRHGATRRPQLRWRKWDRALDRGRTCQRKCRYSAVAKLSNITFLMLIPSALSKHNHYQGIWDGSPFSGTKGVT
jgi:hypothetical protein